MLLSTRTTRQLMAGPILTTAHERYMGMGLDLKIPFVRGSSDVIKFLCVYRCDTSLQDTLVYSTFSVYQEKEQPNTFPFNDPDARTPDNLLIRSS